MRCAPLRLSRSGWSREHPQPMQPMQPTRPPQIPDPGLGRGRRGHGILAGVAQRGARGYPLRGSQLRHQSAGAGGPAERRRPLRPGGRAGHRHSRRGHRTGDGGRTGRERLTRDERSRRRRKPARRRARITTRPDRSTGRPRRTATRLGCTPASDGRAAASDDGCTSACFGSSGTCDGCAATCVGGTSCGFGAWFGRAACRSADRPRRSARRNCSADCAWCFGNAERCCAARLRFAVSGYTSRLSWTVELVAIYCGLSARRAASCGCALCRSAIRL